MPLMRLMLAMALRQFSSLGFWPQPIARRSPMRSHFMARILPVDRRLGALKILHRVDLAPAAVDRHGRHPDTLLDQVLEDVGQVGDPEVGRAHEGLLLATLVLDDQAAPGLAEGVGAGLAESRQADELAPGALDGNGPLADSGHELVVGVELGDLALLEGVLGA